MGLKAVANRLGGGSPGTFTSLTATGLFTQAAEDTITAHAGGGKALATALSATKNLHRVSVVATSGDSILMPAALAGQAHFVRNDGAAPMQVFGAGTDTINGVATATGITQGMGMGVWYVCTTAGAWNTGPVTVFDFRFGTSAADALTLSSIGTLAIATNAGGIKVQIVGAAQPVLRITSDGVLGLNSTTTLATGAIDTGIGRNSAGVLEVNNGTAGTLGSLALSKVTKYNGSTTAGAGVPGIVAAGRATAQAAANASVSTFTVGAADASFEVSMNMNVTVVTTLVTTMTCTYTDESNTARTMVLPVAQLSGSFIAAGAVTGLGAWETPVMHIRCKAGTVITLLTSAGTFTGVTYTVEGIIKQTA